MENLPIEHHHILLSISSLFAYAEGMGMGMGMGIQMADGRRVVSWQREAEHFHIHGLLSHGKGKIRIQIVYFPHTTPPPLSTSSFI